MAFDDLPLTRPDAHAPAPERTGSPTRWVILGAALVIVSALLALWWMSRARPTPTTPAPTTATDVAIGSKRPQRQDLVLPPLDISDTFLRDIIATLSEHPLLTRLLATRGLVRGATLAVVQIGEGKTPATPLAALKPATPLQILGSGS